MHKTLGPGLLESFYEEYKCHELNLQGFSLERQRNNLPKTDGPFYFPASQPRSEYSPGPETHQDHWGRDQWLSHIQQWLGHAAFSTDRRPPRTGGVRAVNHPGLWPFAPVQRPAPANGGPDSIRETTQSNGSNPTANSQGILRVYRYRFAIMTLGL